MLRLLALLLATSLFAAEHKIKPGEDPQAVMDAAAPGDKLTFLPGLHKHGLKKHRAILYVDKSVEIELMAGATLKLADNDFGGYTLTDAYVRYQTSVGGISLSAQNLFNKQYIDYSSDTRLPSDQLSYFAGRGRTFTLGWDYRF